jgi:hypothetical protein
MLKKILGAVLLFSTLLFSQTSTPKPPFPSISLNTTNSGSFNIVTTSGPGALKLFGLVVTVGGATVLTIQDSCTPKLTLGVYNLTGAGSEIDFPLMVNGVSPYFATGNGCSLQFNSTNSVSFQGTVWYYQQ